MTSENPASSPLMAELLSFEDTVEGRQAVLKAFIHARIYVVLDQPWDGKSLPSTETRMLFVSDGENQAQAMLAAFTDRAKAETVMAGMGEFQYPVEVDSMWALLGVPPDAGVRINPNAEPSFRILPALTIELRKIAQQHLATLARDATRA